MAQRGGGRPPPEARVGVAVVDDIRQGHLRCHPLPASVNPPSDPLVAEVHAIHIEETDHDARGSGVRSRLLKELGPRFQLRLCRRPQQVSDQRSDMDVSPTVERHHVELLPLLYSQPGQELIGQAQHIEVRNVGAGQILHLRSDMDRR